MSGLTEAIVISAVVAVAVAWAARSTYRSVRKTGGCSSCGSSGECPLMKDPAALTELQERAGAGPAGSACGDAGTSLAKPAGQKTLS